MAGKAISHEDKDEDPNKDHDQRDCCDHIFDARLDLHQKRWIRAWWHTVGAWILLLIYRHTDPVGRVISA